MFALQLSNNGRNLMKPQNRSEHWKLLSDIEYCWNIYDANIKSAFKEEYNANFSDCNGNYINVKLHVFILLLL